MPSNLPTPHDITYGGSAPYTDYLLNGNWESAREWVSTMTIDPFMDLGTMYIRIKDAAAADDKWLTTGTDAGRFSFRIEKSTTQAMTLQDITCTVQLLMIHQRNVSKQNFTKVNKSVISYDEGLYNDNNVKAGVHYYYYFLL